MTILYLQNYNSNSIVFNHDWINLMTTTSINRQIGSVFLIIGTEIGAGILALPILLARVGIIMSILILIVSWAVMLFTALLICELNLSMPGKNNFASMAENFLGRFGKYFLTVVFWCTLSSIGMAYMSAAGSTMNHLFKMPIVLSSVIFVGVFGTCVVLGTTAVDYVTRAILSPKLILFILATVFLFATVKMNNLNLNKVIINVYNNS